MTDYEQALKNLEIRDREIIRDQAAAIERLRAESKHNAECAGIWSTKYTEACQQVVQVEHEHGTDIGHLRAAEVRLADAQAEIERLRAELGQALAAERNAIAMLDGEAAAEARLATATALIQEVWDSGDIPRKIGLKLQRFLASAQPAAPEPADEDAAPLSAGFLWRGR